MIYDYFRVTGAHDTVLDYADLFSVTLRYDEGFVGEEKHRSETSITKF